MRKKVVCFLLVLCVLHRIKGISVEGFAQDDNQLNYHAEESKMIYSENSIVDKKPDIINGSNEDFIVPMDL